MPRVFHNQQNIAANHSLYQNELLNETHSTLKQIETNTKNINLNVDTVEVSVDSLEVLQAQTNTTLAAMLVDTDAIDSSCNTIEAQSVLTASRLNNIQNKLSVNTDGTGNTLGQINSNILTKNGEIESSLNSLISANHTDLVALETSLTSLEGKIDTLDGVQDNALAKLTNIETLITTLDGVQDNALVKHTNNETLLTAISADGDAVQSLLTTIDGVLDASLVKQTNIESLITTLDGVQDNALAKLTNIETLITTLDGVQDNALVKHTNNETLLTAISADGDAVQSLLTTIDGVLDASLVKQTNIESLITTLDGVQDNALVKLGEIETTNNANQVLLGTIDSDTNAIKNAVEGTLTVASHAVTNAGTFAVQASVSAALPAGDNNIGNVDIASAIPAGDNNIGNVDIASSLPAGTNAIGKLSANSGVDIGDVDVTSISAGSNRIGMVGLKANEAVDGSGTERFVLCDAAGHLQVDVLSGGGSTDVSALSTHAKQDTIIGHLDGVEGKLDAIETTNNACQVLLGTIDADTNAIKTAVQLLDNAISGSEMQVDIVSSALPSGAATQTTLASILAKNTEIETTNNANQVLLGTIDSDTDNIKTATEAIENAVHVDDAGYTLGTHSVMMMGGFAGTQAVGANDAGALAMTTTGFLKIVNPMTTTQIDDGKSVSAGASTTSSVLNVTHVPTGRITFVMDPAVISVGDIQIDSVQYSLDGTLYLQLYTENLSTRDATGHKLIQVKDFFAPHFRIHFTNQSGGSNETNLDIWAIY